MLLEDIKNQIPKEQYDVLSTEIKELRPSQEKAINRGLLDNKNLLICTPTASGKTLIAELAMIKKIIESKEKAIYIVPLKALATEKFREFKNKYSSLCRVAMSIGDLDSSDDYLANFDIIVCTSEKLDSLMRHHTPWISKVGILVIDEIHLLNDQSRGPTLEIIITMLRQIRKDVQIIGLSATIGNPEELSGWLSANLVEDFWRPVKLEKGIYYDKKLEFKEK